MRPRYAVPEENIVETLVTFVISHDEGNIHVLVNDIAPMDLVETIARNFSWILYRQHQSGVMKKRYPGITASEISTATSKMWRLESKDVRAYWKKQAQEEDRLHKEKYPNYKFTAKKSSPK
ncbi:hypothetical protein CP532_0653, partial [Ophiocordyceps camponoti-leonardi (nom. inval.)]